MKKTLFEAINLASINFKQQQARAIHW